MMTGSPDGTGFGFFLYLLIELLDKTEQGWGVYGRMDGRTTDTFWPVLTLTPTQTKTKGKLAHMVFMAYSINSLFVFYPF